jgi:hypothetical protein
MLSSGIHQKTIRFALCRRKTSFPTHIIKTATFVAGLIMTVASGSAIASVTFASTNGTQSLSASATFADLGGGQIQITLSNTFSGDTPDQSHVLTGLFFSGLNGLTPLSATAGLGSLEWAGPTSSAPESSFVLGTEWAYGTGSAPGGATAGIISAGYYSPGSGNFASPGDMLDGSGYGILSLGYAGSDLDGLGNRPYIQNSMVFVLSGFGGNLVDISHVSFQYGTSLSESALLNAPQVPEPTMGAFLAAATAAMLLRCRWRSST